MKLITGISALAMTIAMAGGALAADLTVGVSWSNFQEERWKTDEAAIKSALEAAGASYISTDAQSSSGKQLADIESLIAQGADALIILRDLIATGLRFPDSYFQDLASDYQARRDFLMDALLECGLLPTQPMGSYFVLADISNFPHANSLDFCRYLVKEVGVAAIPPASFYMNQEHGEQLVRFCYCKSWEVLQAGVDRLKKM